MAGDRERTETEWRDLLTDGAMIQHATGSDLE
jgi:hypothetical protein